MSEQQRPGDKPDAPMTSAPGQTKPLPAPEKVGGPQEGVDLVMRLAERQPGPKPEK